MKMSGDLINLDFILSLRAKSVVNYWRKYVDTCSGCSDSEILLKILICAVNKEYDLLKHFDYDFDREFK